MATKLGLYNAALTILKDRQLATLTDANRSRRILDSVYDDVVAYTIEQGFWNFAQRSVLIEPDPGVESGFGGFTNAFEYPSDLVRVVKISDSPHFYPTLEHYLDEGRYFYAHTANLYLMYVSDGVSYGGDLSMWPATFTLATAYELAKRAGPQIATLGGAEKDRLDRDAKRALIDARGKDASRQPVDRMQPGRLARARSGSRSNGRGIWDF